METRNNSLTEALVEAEGARGATVVDEVTEVVGVTLVLPQPGRTRTLIIMHYQRAQATSLGSRITPSHRPLALIPAVVGMDVGVDVEEVMEGALEARLRLDRIVAALDL